METTQLAAWCSFGRPLGAPTPCLPDSWAPLPAWAGVSPWPQGHRVQGFADARWHVPGIPGRRRRGGQTLQRQDANPGLPPTALTRSGWRAPGSRGDWLAGCSDPAVPPAHAWPPGHTAGKDRCPHPAPQRRRCLAVAQGLGWLRAPWEPRGQEVSLRSDLLSLGLASGNHQLPGPHFPVCKMGS